MAEKTGRNAMWICPDTALRPPLEEKLHRFQVALIALAGRDLGKVNHRKSSQSEFLAFYRHSHLG